MKSKPLKRLGCLPGIRTPDMLIQSPFKDSENKENPAIPSADSGKPRQNPHHQVRQSAKRTRVPDVLTAEEIGKLLGELAEPWRTAVFVAVTTGLRVSELLALKWSDVDCAAGEIRLSRCIVRQHIGLMKSEAGRKPVPLDAGLDTYWLHGAVAVPTIKTPTKSSAVPTSTDNNRTGLTRRWKITSVPPHYARRSRSASAGIRSVTRLEPWSRAKARMLLLRKRCCVTLT